MMKNVSYYRKKTIQPMIEWHPEINMELVSISEVDRNNGSPKAGDMIAFNLDDKKDLWLVAEQFIIDNYEEVPRGLVKGESNE